MRLVGTKSDVREWVAGARGEGETVALVPTMGYLHRGHLSLVEIATRSADRVALSIFVNPLQFGAGEDLDRYPRDLDRDVELARNAGVDLVFAPTAIEMYPEGEPWVAVSPGRGSDRLCGGSRPGHFRGVLTVVAKLFGVFTPDAAVFGQKDYQQLVLIRRMVEDLDFAVRVHAAPIVREPDGLAMSSRNVYLSDEDRARARSISEAMRACQEMFSSGTEDGSAYVRKMEEVAGGRVDLEYAQVVHPRTLETVERVFEGAVCATAARVGATRLIDNQILGS